MPKALRRCQPFALTALLLSAAPADAASDRLRWVAEAQRVTITRDDWGIAHVDGQSDADAVFGAIFAQAEDDFGRIEANYLTSLGLNAAAGAGGEAIWTDLRQRLWVDEGTLRRAWASSPPWLKRLTIAWADGLNFYLATHPAVRPRLLTHFEPWMALSFSEGSIGGDIESVSPAALRAFYGGGPLPVVTASLDVREPTGSNGIAIAPKDSADGHALLLINPHTSFFFRSELGMRSGEGLHAYGASTWGQFFLYQGWNERVGWMHTSTTVDNIDEFAETVTHRGGRLVYRYGRAWLPVMTRTLSVPLPGGAARTFQVYATRHGPIVRADGGRWIAVSLMNRPVAALEQSWLRTKARSFAAFRQVAELRANSSNNTVYADADGRIAFLPPQFVPARSTSLDYTHPVDGSDPAASWRGDTPLDRLPQVVDPAIGWVRNTNDWPWSVAGADSPHAADYPSYLDQVGENPRGLHADALLATRHKLTPQALTALAFDPDLPAFHRLLPALFAAYDALGPGDPQRAQLRALIALLRGWNARWAGDSVATTLAVYWGEALLRAAAIPARQGLRTIDRMAATTSAAKLDALVAAQATLREAFGRWQVPWGEVNRFQRMDDAISPHFRDDAPSIPVPFTSAFWGSLASFGTRAESGTARRYGVSGNSFVAVVDFGPRVKAWAVTAGGESGDPRSPHFDDQATRYAGGALRPVYFWPDELTGHVERRYHPGG